MEKPKKQSRKNPRMKNRRQIEVSKNWNWDKQNSKNQKIEKSTSLKVEKSKNWETEINIENLRLLKIEKLK